MATRMSKKHYELIAGAIKDGYEGLAFGDYDTFESIAYMVAIELSAQDPKFDRDKFLKACGAENELDPVTVAECEHEFVNGQCIKCTWLEE